MKRNERILEWKNGHGTLGAADLLRDGDRFPLVAPLLRLLLHACRRLLGLTLLVTAFVLFSPLSLLENVAGEAGDDESSRYISG